MTLVHVRALLSLVCYTAVCSVVLVVVLVLESEALYLREPGALNL